MNNPVETVRRIQEAANQPNFRLPANCLKGIRLPISIQYVSNQTLVFEFHRTEYSFDRKKDGDKRLTIHVGSDGEPVVRSLDGSKDDDGEDSVIHQSVAGVKHTKLYSYTADTINIDDVVKISNEICKNQGRDYIIAIEGVTYGNINKAMDVLCDMEKAGQIKLCLSRGSAISAVMSSLKS